MGRRRNTGKEHQRRLSALSEKLYSANGLTATTGGALVAVRGSAGFGVQSPKTSVSRTQRRVALGWSEASGS